MTNNEAEMNAILLAVSTITKPVHLTVYTDSQVAWWYVEKGTRNLPRLSKIADKIEHVCKTKGIILKVVKAKRTDKVIEYTHSEATQAWQKAFGRS
jgi:ribonuclease HI